VPTLAKVLRKCRGKVRVLIEIKGADPRKVSAVIVKQCMERDVMVFSLSISRLKAFAEAAPYIARFGLIARNLDSQIARLKSAVSVRGLGLSRRLVTSPRIVQRIHRRGWKVFVWTVNREAEMRKLARWGVDGLITNHPDRALELRKTK
jgi:glycerophosphoryl diester phosphodiesterase